MKVLSKNKALRFDAGGLNEDVVFNVYFKSDNPKYHNMDGFGNNPPAVFQSTNVFSLLERLEDELEDDVAITAVEESLPMEVNAFNDGGEISEGNLEMILSDVKAIKHHADELSKIVNKNTPIEAWVVSKISRAETDLSDVTHYLDGLKMAKGGMMAEGGRVHFTIDDEKIDSLLNNSRMKLDFMDDDGYLLSSKDFAKLEEIVSNLGYDSNKIIVHNYNYGMGGATAEGVDLFEDYDNIPKNVQKVLDTFEHDFIEGNYSGLDKALKAVQKLGYTFEYYLDGQAYNLRPIGKKGKNKDIESGYFEKGGGVKDGVMADGGLIKPEKPIEKMTKLELMRFVQKIDPLKNFYPKTTEAGRVQAKTIYEKYLERKRGKMADGGYMAKGGKTNLKFKSAMYPDLNSLLNYFKEKHRGDNPLFRNMMDKSEIIGANMLVKNGNLSKGFLNNKRTYYWDGKRDQLYNKNELK